MEKRRLGHSGIEVSEVSLGCWTMGGPNWSQGNPVGWADVDEGECIEAVHHALDRGVNHFDNADVYGNGRAERMLAKALGERRKDVVIATKVGHFKGTAVHAYDPLHIRHQCEQSLRNLKTDTIDVYYFHHGDFGESDMYVDGAVEVANRLKDEGKIRAIGLSAYSDDDFTRLVPKIKPTALQSWAHCMDDGFIRSGGAVNQLLEAYDMAFVAFSPLNQGILLGKYSSEKAPSFPEGDIRGSRDKFKADKLQAANVCIDQVKEMFGSSIEEMARVALQYVLAHDRVACVIPGFRNKRQVECNLAAAGKPLSDAEVRTIRDIYEACPVGQ
ncbi:MAG: aldo/keto reductase [Planctomycetales bacterium]|nr:aldo/keto reductase [Planctomycetales bacterium]